VLGGTVFLFQFLLALVGFGAEDFELGDDLPDDVDLDVPDDVSHGASPVDHGSTWMFGVVSFRTVVAALTFFGLVGLASLEAGWGSALSAILAVVAGFAAMWGVHWLMQRLYRLRHDGSQRIERSVGRTATVYIPIPPNQSGTGKVQLEMQGRIVEYAAMSSESEKLPTGAKVTVVDYIGPHTLMVAPIRETVISS
jgi:membrane protein implicated in regulation of membrane protease activity